MKDCKVLISLDCLLDTVLGTIDEIAPKAVIPLLENGYLNRIHNTLSMFCKDIDDIAFRERYASRDISILKRSKKTSLVGILAAHVGEYDEFNEHPEAQNYKFVINTYPYNINDYEIKELFITLKMLLNVQYLTRVHLPISSITPEYLITNKFNRFIIPSFDEWVTINGALLKTTRIPFITCVAPLCYAPGKELLGEEDAVMKWTSAGFSPYLDVEFITLADTSIEIIPINTMSKIPMTFT